MIRKSVGVTAFLVAVWVPAAAGQEASIEELRWLTGAWEARLGGARIEEHWIEPSGKTMLGLSRTVVAGRTVAFEFLRIEARSSALVYVAQPNGRPGTEFTLTQLAPQAAVFENPEHDHPKIVRYRRNADGTLSAQVEGDEKGEPVRQEFLFRPMKQE